MFLLFELIMRYCDYKTFQKCSLLNKECNRICRKLVRELKRNRMGENFFETFWRGEKQSLSYYITDSYLKILDYDCGEIVAKFIYNSFVEYLEIDERQYIAVFDWEKEQVIFDKIQGYERIFVSLKPIKNSKLLFN